MADAGGVVTYSLIIGLGVFAPPNAAENTRITFIGHGLPG